jgi:hypothetical protein
MGFRLAGAVLLLSAWAAGATRAGKDTEDGHGYYALDSWMGAIGLPDDCFKSVVDADGAFRTEIGRTSHRTSLYPLAQNQSPVKIQARLAGAMERVDQRMLGPRVPISISRKRHGAIHIEETLFLARPLDWSAAVLGTDLKGRDSQPRPRQYLLMTEYTNTGTQPEAVTPVVDVQGATPGPNLDDDRMFVVALNTYIQTTEPIRSVGHNNSGTLALKLNPLIVPPGGEARWVLAINRNGFRSSAPVGWSEAQRLRAESTAYWETSTGLPYGVIEVPDARIQAEIDTSIRELYQMRYVIGGLPVFFFGPGVYNDYWVLDGSFVTEALTLLGRAEDAGGYADYMLQHQQPDGRIQCMSMHWKEDGIALVTLFRHAQMRRDKSWLRQRWPQFRRAVQAISKLRRWGSSADPKALNYRLSPEGFGDGGIGFTAEFTNNYWLLAGLKAGVEAARWLGESQDAAAWDAEYQDFIEVFQKAIARDAKTDDQGNRYIPAVMGPAAPDHPTRGQWAFMHGVYPGRIFAADDPLMLGTLKMLEAREVQGGIVEDSGWIGIWPQCASFYGHDWLWLGQGQKAARLLYAFARHASPVWNFREEMPRQIVPGEVFPYEKGGGDMPHVSAAAELIRLTSHLLAFDRGPELHLLEGLPAEWLRPGMRTRLNGLATPFGPLTLSLEVSSSGRTATFRMAPIQDPECRRIVLHLGGWASGDPGAVRELAVGQSQEVELELNGARGSGK